MASTDVYNKHLIALCKAIHVQCGGVTEGATLLEAGTGTFLVLAVLIVSAILFQNRKTARRPKRSRDNELGSSDLADTAHLQRWFRKPKPLDTPLSVTDIKGSRGSVMKKATLQIPFQERNRHVLMIAKTGSGKTTKAILPILYQDCMCQTRSTIVLDSKPEMWGKLGMMTRTYNPKKNIMLFNPLDPERSLSWNILGKIEDDTDAKLIANTIIMATDNPSSKADSPFFRNNALQVLNALMVGLLHDPEETLSMPRVHELIHSGKEPLCTWLEKHPHALKSTRTFVELCRSGSQNADTILSELSMRIAAWDLPAIRATTSKDEIDLEKLISEPSLFILELRESEIEMLRPLANVIVVEILRFLTKRAEHLPKQTLPRPVGLVIDEFASALGRLPDIHVKLNTLRSRNVSIVAAIQSIGQIKANYGQDADSVIAGFGTKILMPMLDYQDAEWASKETGTMTIRFRTAQAGMSKKIIEHFANRNKGYTEQVQQRAVLTPDEIGRPVDNISTFFMPDTPAFQGNLVPYYKIPEMIERISKFDKPEKYLKLRDEPIYYEEHLPDSPPPQQAQKNEPLTEEAAYELIETLERLKKALDWENTTGVAREWWESFEEENAKNLPLVVSLAEEILKKRATINDFFLAYVYSESQSVQETLNYMEKMKEEKKLQAAGGAVE